MGSSVFVQFVNLLAVDEYVHLALTAHLQILSAGGVEEISECFVDDAPPRHWPPVAVDQLIEFLQLIFAESQNHARLTPHVNQSQVQMPKRLQLGDRASCYLGVWNETPRHYIHSWGRQATSRKLLTHPPPLAPPYAWRAGREFNPRR